MRKFFRTSWYSCATISVGILLLMVMLFHTPIGQVFQPIDSRTTVVLIVLDDLDWDLVADDLLATQTEQVAAEHRASPRFPTIQALANSGVVFTNFHSTTPVCGPARASILSGQYAHRHQVRVNRPSHPTSNGFPGGFPAYSRYRDFSKYLQANNYQTCFVGKYVHEGFEPNHDQGIYWRDLLPSGWDRFHACLGAQYQGFWTVDSNTAKTQRTANHFRVDYEADQVIQMLAEQKSTRKAQLVCWFSLAPHDSSNSEVAYPARLESMFADEMPPVFQRHPGSRNLQLPSLLSGLPETFNAEQTQFIVEKWRERLRSLKAFDENLSRVRLFLAKEGRLENTVFIITSDHGYRLGDHGHVGKRLPYDPITRVPLIVSGQGVGTGTCDQLLANIDLAPTIVDWMAGQNAVPAAEMDGLSFANLLRDPTGELPQPRPGVLFECWESENIWGDIVPGCWTCLRTTKAIYTEWTSGEREFYDLERDPQQLVNRISELSAEEVGKLRAHMHSLRPQQNSPLLAIPQDHWSELRTEKQNPTFAPLAFAGFVDADQGISQVEVEIVDQATQQCWNGKQWDSHSTWLATDVLNANGIMSQWIYQFQFDGPPVRTEANGTVANNSPADRVSDDFEQRLKVSVRATDRLERQSAWSDDHEIVVRPNDPETWIRLPSDTGEAGLKLSGVAAGTVRFVRLVIQDKSTQLYWNGSEWASDFTQVKADLSASLNGRTEWTYNFVGTEWQDLYVAARAVDFQRNFDQTVAFVNLRNKRPSGLSRNLLLTE